MQESKHKNNYDKLPVGFPSISISKLTLFVISSKLSKQIKINRRGAQSLFSKNVKKNWFQVSS